MVSLVRGSIRGKMLWYILVPTLFALLGLSAYVGYGSMRMVERKTYQLAEASASGAANGVSAYVGDLLASSRTMIRAVEMVDPARPDARDQVLKILKHMLGRTPLVMSTWVIFEPNAFDGRDHEFVNRDGYKEKGRFMGTFLKVNGRISRSFDITEQMLSSEADAGSWYLSPLRSGKITVTDPYFYNYTGVQGDDKFIASICIPIEKDGKVVGVGGMDVDLSALKDAVRTLGGAGGAMPTLVSDGGVVAGSYDDGAIGKITGQVAKGKAPLDAIGEAIKSGSARSFRGVSLFGGPEVLGVAVPVSIGVQRWGLLVEIPVGVALGDVYRLVRNITISVLFTILALGGLIWVISGRLSLPIVEAMKAVERFADLDLRYDPSSD